MFVYKKALKYNRRHLVPLWVLLWKFATTRAYRYCHTFWEVFGGASVFCILFLAYQTTIHEYKHEAIHKDSVTRVFYTPYNNFTRKLMGRVEDYLSHNDSGLPNLRWKFRRLKSVKNKKIFNNLTTKWIALVNFTNKGSLTPDLNYTINVRTSEPNNYFHKAYHGFLHSIIPKEEIAPPYLAPLQWAIDKSYIEQLVDHNIDQKVMLSTTRQYLSQELRTLHKFMILCTIVAPLPFFLVYSSRLIMERRSGLRELMKLSGINYDILRVAHILETLVVGILYSIPVIIILKITAQAILPYSQWFIVAYTLVLHFVSTMTLTLVTASLSQDFHHSDTLGFLLYMSTFILDILWYPFKEYRVFTFLICCTLPHAPVYMFWDEVIYLESIGVGTQFSNIRLRHSDDVMCVSCAWLCFYIQITLIVSISWYLDLVRPGKFGIAKRWDFLFQKSYWFPPKKQYRIKPQASLQDINSKYFQKGPSNAEIAVNVVDVSKVFKQSDTGTEVAALDTVTFDCYRGEVTIVLGANGAGKTTLMHIVAGMFSATQGTVYVKGVDVAHKVLDYPVYMGLCMQQNICFKSLTVKENILFFQKLRKDPKKGFTAAELMKTLKLTKLANRYSSQLCTGGFRSLQVACALVGDADVLVLDEPTTGMDVEVRHSLWDLIMTVRGKKTVLMTTSCLEEANALGDRIVILNNGNIRCHGTPAFLKDAIGTSFTLSISIKDSTRLMHLKEMVDQIIPDLKCNIHDMRRITFSLPTGEFQKFPELFHALEEKEDEYGIILMDVGMFLEEVFSKFIEEEEEVLDQYSTTSSKYRSKHRTKDFRIAGYKQVCRRMKLLLIRAYHYMWTKIYQLIFLRILLPIICLIIVTLTTNYSLRHVKMLSHQITSHFHEDVNKLVYYGGPFRRRGVVEGLQKYPGVEPLYAVDVDREFTGPPENYMTKQTIGFKITDNYTKIYHASDPSITSKSINMFSNIYLSTFMPYFNHSIHTKYAPLSDPRGEKIEESKSVFLCIKWTAWVTFLSTLLLTPVIILSILELSGGIRDNHMMAGCTPILHWGSNLLAHMSIFLLFLVVPVIIIAMVLDFDHTFTQERFLGSVFGLFFVFGLAFLANLYLLSFFLNENYAIGQIYILSMLFGLILPIPLAVMEPIWHGSILISILYFILAVLGRFSPVFAFGVGLGRLTLQARLNAYCTLNKHLCPNLVINDPYFKADICCGSTDPEPFPYFTSYETGLFDLINLIFLFVIFSMLVILLDYGIPQYLKEQISLNTYKEPAQTFRDENVAQEKKYVRMALRKHDFETDILLADNLHKDYAHQIRKQHTLNAVKGITFAAKLGECLAILGSQNTGKSSLINMLAGNLVMTRGDAYINGIHIRTNRMKYIHKISLSSTNGGMDGFMTGPQNLMLIARMKGYPDNMAYKLSHMALRYMGLQASSTLVSKYSSGCLRRLSLCCMLVLAPQVALLDEPMREMDSSSKPLIAKALHRLMLEPAAVIVSETSVDWRLLQSVFTRIAIMSKGQFAAIGPAEEILESVAKGFTARIKLRMVTAYSRDKLRSDEDESSDSDPETYLTPTTRRQKSITLSQRVTEFKEDFLKVFETSRLTGEHLCMLYFYIHEDEKIQLFSDMFAKMQELKEKYEDIVEDYYLSSATIEDFFWRLEYDKETQNLPNSTSSKKMPSKSSQPLVKSSQPSVKSSQPSVKKSQPSFKKE